MMQNQSLHHYYAVAFKQQIGEGNPVDLCRRYLSSAQRDFHRAIVTFNLLKENRVPETQKQAPKSIHIVPKPQPNQQEPNELTPEAPQERKTQPFSKASRKARKQQRGKRL